VLITAELPEDDVDTALERAEALVNALLVPPTDPGGMDEVKREQLSQLAQMKDTAYDDKGKEIKSMRGIRSTEDRFGPGSGGSGGGGYSGSGYGSNDDPRGYRGAPLLNNPLVSYGGGYGGGGGSSGGYGGGSGGYGGGGGSGGYGGGSGGYGGYGGPNGGRARYSDNGMFTIIITRVLFLTYH
jgi:hypothetical protein